MMKSIKMPIRFKYEIDKFIACMGIFAQKVNDFDKLKACKLLYYADKFHLLKYGRPILGDVYKHLDYGPVPTQSLFIMNEVIRENSKTSDIPDAQKRFTNFIKVNKNIFQKKHPIFEIDKEPNLDCLSASEQEAIQETIKRYGHLKGGKLIDETHKDATIKKTDLYDEIDYRLFFDEEKEAQPAAFEYLESLREDSELLFGLAQ